MCIARSTLRSPRHRNRDLTLKGPRPLSLRVTERSDMSREPQSSSQPGSNGGADPTASLPAEQSLSSALSPNDPALTRLLSISRWASITVVGLLVVSVPVTLFTAVSKESDKRKCGVDWMLWLVGSN